MKARIEARDAAGSVRYDAMLQHGEDPERTLAIAGWEAQWRGAVTGRSADGQSEVVLHYDVCPGPSAFAFQRLAAYAVVTAHYDGRWSVLLTSYADSRSGHWGLPGGGIDDGEDSAAAVHREVWEETGQYVADLTPYVVGSSHWVGAAPSGRFENFHAVRLIYTAHCPQPSAPVVHDVGGSTDEAAWFSVADLHDGPPVQSWSREVLTQMLGPFPGRAAPVEKE